MIMSGKKRMMHSDDWSADSWKIKRRNWNESGIKETDDVLGAADAIKIFPPLRLTKNLSAAAATGNDQSLEASEKEKQFAEVLFYIKIDKFLNSHSQMVLSALEAENLVIDRDAKLTDDGNFKVDILVEGVLIARGEGKTPIVAQEDAMEDFVERSIAADFLRVDFRANRKKEASDV